MRKISSVPENCYDLLSKLLEFKPMLRPSISQVLQHSIITDFLKMFNILSIIPFKSSSELTIPTFRQDSSSMNIGLEEVEGTEKRIAKLQKYNQASQNIHMPPFFKKRKYNFCKQYDRDSIEVKSVKKTGIHVFYKNTLNSKSTNNIFE